VKLLSSRRRKPALYPNDLFTHHAPCRP
jgi:hypothetical protein